MAIEIQGYKRVSDDNSVYVRDDTITRDGKPVSVQRIILPKRVIKPSAEDIANYLQRKAQEPDTGKSDCGHDECITIDQMVGTLPKQLLDAIKRKRADFLEFVKDNAPETHGNYLQVRYGLAEPAHIRKAETVIKESGMKKLSASSKYDITLSDDGLPEDLGEEYCVEIELNHGALPPRADMDVLMRCNTTRSDTLHVRRKRSERCTELMELIYAALPTAEHVQQIPDVSRIFLENTARGIIVGMCKKMVLKDMEAALFGRSPPGRRLPPFSEQ